MIKFNQTTTLDGLVQFYEKRIGADYGYVSGNETRLREFTAWANEAKRRYFAIAIQASGTWELDDSNHTDSSVIYATLTSGVGNYSFLVDANGNDILDFYKVLILPTATATRYQELTPVDENQTENLSIIDESNPSGVPSTYSKRGNGIRFNTIPDYTVARGIKILINRAGTDFEYDNTTETAGYPYHNEYFYLRPSLTYASIYGLDSLGAIEKEVLKLEGIPEKGVVGLIAKAYGNRKKDEIDSFSGEYINSV